MSHTLAAAAVAILLAIPAITQAAPISITGDFSTAANPGGPWSYGWLDHLDGQFTKYSAHPTATAGGTIAVWNDPQTILYGAPSVWNNASALPFATGTVNYQPGWAGFHPGPSNQLSDFRFTAPTSGNYAVALDFQGADWVGTSTDVHVHAGGIDLFHAFINGYGDNSRKSYSGELFLNAGQTLDIAVGYGKNSTFWYDSTALRGSIAAIPEPAGYAMMLTGLGLLAFSQRRGRQQTSA